MIFTCGLAADILFYSFCEWIYYADESRVQALGSMEEWVSTMPLFHWGPIPWAFYATLAACFGFMIHVRKCNKQKYSEACRPILGDKTDKLPGKIIDVLAVIALIAGTATTFSVATPLLSVLALISSFVFFAKILSKSVSAAKTVNKQTDDVIKVKARSIEIIAFTLNLLIFTLTSSLYIFINLCRKTTFLYGTWL